MTNRPPIHHSHGFALLEVMLACALLTTVAAALAQVVATAIRVEGEAGRRTVATVLAVQKMEQLRALELRNGVTDATTDVSLDPPGDGGPGLSPSPAGTLESNTPSYVDYADANGGWVGHGSSPPATAVYIRRWSIEWLPDDPGDTLVLQVAVTSSRVLHGPLTGGRRASDDIRLVSLKTRRGV